MASTPSSHSLPCVTADQMRDIDRVATEEYQLHPLQRMENAGRHLAHLAREQFLEGQVQNRRVLVVCGTGGNGGGGLVAARHLHNWGATVLVRTSAPAADYRGVPAHQRKLLRRLGTSIEPADPDGALPDADLVLDALMGYGFEGDLRAPMEHLIHQIIWHAAPALSLDVPSGLNPTTGVPSKTTVHAEATLTLALPKCGFDAPAAQSAVGALYLADIGIPPALYEGLGLSGALDTLFAEQDLLQLRAA